MAGRGIACPPPLPSIQPHTIATTVKEGVESTRAQATPRHLLDVIVVPSAVCHDVLLTESLIGVWSRDLPVEHFMREGLLQMEAVIPELHHIIVLEAVLEEQEGG